MFKDFNRNQDFLLPPSLGDLIPENSLVYVVAEVIEKLDLQPLYDRYDPLGQNGYHPAMMLGVLFYAYANGIFSSRKIATQLKQNICFMYLAGMQTPDFRTISDFRKNNIDLLKHYFCQIVQTCREAGMTPLNSIAIDSSKVQAAASRKKTVDGDTLAEQLAATQQEIDRLLKAAEDIDREEERTTDDRTPAALQIKNLKQIRQRLKDAKARLDDNPRQKKVNLTDPDCRIQRGVGNGYSSQIAVDCQHQIIVGTDVVPDSNDTHQLLPMIEDAEVNTKSKGQSKQIYADSGYASAAAFRHLGATPHIDAYVPTREQVARQRAPDNPFDKSHFDLDPVRGIGRCPLGRPMRILRRGVNKSGEAYINFIGTECHDCSSKAQCTRASYRNVVMLLSQPVVDLMKDKMDSLAGWRAMRLRKQTAEPVFGQLKEHLGFRRFHLRGLPKVKGEFALLCAAFNLKKLHLFLHGKALAGALAQIRVISSLTTHFLCYLWSFFDYRRENINPMLCE